MLILNARIKSEPVSIFCGILMRNGERIAGNEFAYCNGLSAGDYLTLFDESGFDVCRKEAVTNDEARENMGNGFYG